MKWLKAFTPLRVSIGFGLLLIMSWVGNVWVYSSMQLEKPLFLEQMSSFSTNEEEIAFYFLENKASGKKVVEIKIDGLPYLTYWIEERKQYSHQVLKVLYYKPHTEAIQYSANKELTLHDIIVLYDDGTSEKISIGEIRLYQEEESVKGSLVKQTFSGGSTSGDGKTALRMLQPAILERVELGQSEEVGRVLHLMLNEVNYTDLREMELSTDDPLRITYQWDISEIGIGSMAVFNPEVLLYFKLEDHSTVVQKVNLDMMEVQFSEEEIRTLVRRKGGE